MSAAISPTNPPPTTLKPTPTTRGRRRGTRNNPDATNPPIETNLISLNASPSKAIDSNNSILVPVLPQEPIPNSQALSPDWKLSLLNSAEKNKLDALSDSEYIPSDFFQTLYKRFFQKSIILSFTLTSLSLVLASFIIHRISKKSTSNEMNSVNVTEVTVPDLRSLYFQMENEIKILTDRVKSIESKSLETAGFKSVFEKQTKNVIANLTRMNSKINDLDSSLKNLYSNIDSTIRNRILENFQSLMIDFEHPKGSEMKGIITLEDVRKAAKKLINEEFESQKRNFDDMPDYALGSVGGKVIHHSEAIGNNPFFNQLEKLLNRMVYSRRFNLHPKALHVIMPHHGIPGHCLPLKTISNATIDISLRALIRPTYVTLEHVAKEIAFEIQSAPRDFLLFGFLKNKNMYQKLPNFQKLENSEMLFLGKFRYEVGKSAIQRFELPHVAKPPPIDRIRIEIVSNHGHSLYTCVYRFRVHGNPIQD